MAEINTVSELLSRLQKFGAFEWHTSKVTGSAYIKFRDCRLGSI